MGIEIERKFLVSGDGWQSLASGVRFVQGYFCSDPVRSVRVRIEGEVAKLTVKSGGMGLIRKEFEYPIPIDDARQMLDELCEPPLIEKLRYTIEWAGKTWEIDAFSGQNAGLVVAEIELSDPSESFEHPPWLGPEVSDDSRYLNSNLARRPYQAWSEEC